MRSRGGNSVGEVCEKANNLKKRSRGNDPQKKVQSQLHTVVWIDRGMGSGELGHVELVPTLVLSSTKPIANGHEMNKSRKLASSHKCFALLGFCGPWWCLVMNIAIKSFFFTITYQYCTVLYWYWVHVYPGITLFQTPWYCTGYQYCNIYCNMPYYGTLYAIPV